MFCNWTTNRLGTNKHEIKRAEKNREKEKGTMIQFDYEGCHLATLEQIHASGRVGSSFFYIKIRKLVWFSSIDGLNVPMIIQDGIHTGA